MRWLPLVGLFGFLVFLAGCVNQEADLPPSTLVPRVVATVTPTPRLWTSDELRKNTVVFKQDTGLAVNAAYQGDNFVIEYEGSLVAYYVNIDATDASQYRQVKKEVEQVFKGAGATDLCGIRIFFFPPKSLLASLTKEDIYATGCRSLL